MPTFAFQAKTIQGKVVKGTLQAKDDTDARVQLKTQHLMPLKVKEKGDKNPGLGSLTLPGTSKKRGIPTKELQAMTRQFATLINAGIPILNSISILISSSKNKHLKSTLINVSDRIMNGSSLSDALSANSHIFDSVYVSMIRAGETAGFLDTSLQSIATYIERAEKIKGKVKSAFWYPASVLVISIIIVAIMMVYVIPKFEELFTQSDMELPVITQFVLNISHFIRDYWYFIILSMIGCVIGMIAFYKSKEGRQFIDSNLLKLPFFGSLIQKSALAKSCRTFASMLSGGVFILDSLDVSGDTSGNFEIQKVFKDARNFVVNGDSITVSFSQNRYIPNMVVQMISIGEQTGSLDVLMQKLATFYEDEVEQSTSGLISLIEPFMIVFLGLTVGFIVISMYLPIFQIAGAGI